MGRGLIWVDGFPRVDGHWVQTFGQWSHVQELCIGVEVTTQLQQIINVLQLKLVFYSDRLVRPYKHVMRVMEVDWSSCV